MPAIVPNIEDQLPRRARPSEVVLVVFERLVDLLDGYKHDWTREESLLVDLCRSRLGGASRD